MITDHCKTWHFTVIFMIWWLIALDLACLFTDKINAVAFGMFFIAIVDDVIGALQRRALLQQKIVELEDHLKDLDEKDK